ncbi:MAG: hypothetical protein ABGY96_11530 [bacterium]|nr:hypothetical protein [Gammaproteobacteria bacterium]
MPGFIDPHTHLRLSGTYMGLNYVGPIASTDPMRSYWRDWLTEMPFCAESKADFLLHLQRLRQTTRLQSTSPVHAGE